MNDHNSNPTKNTHGKLRALRLVKDDEAAKERDGHLRGSSEDLSVRGLGVGIELEDVHEVHTPDSPDVDLRAPRPDDKDEAEEAAKDGKGRIVPERVWRGP